MLAKEIFKNVARPKGQPQKTGLLVFESQQNRKDTMSYENSRDSIFWRLSERFSNQMRTLSVVPSLFARNTGTIERFLWLMVFVAALFGMIYVNLILSARYFRGEFKTIIDDAQHPVYKIPFPEITICNRNRLNWGRFTEAKRRYFDGAQLSADHEDLFTRIVAQYDTLEMGTYDRFDFLTGNPMLKDLNHINFTAIAEFMAWRCDEVLSNCTWNLRPYNCCEIMFLRKWQSGFCLAFNSVENVEGRRMREIDRKYPWRTGRNGPGSGLTVNFTVNPTLHSPMSTNEKGLTFMIVEPDVYFYLAYDVLDKTHTSVSMNAFLVVYDDNTRIVPSKKRECVFLNEQNVREYMTLPGYVYMIENCMAQCQQLHLMRHCNCTMDISFPPGPYPPCKLVDFPCVAKHNDRMKFFEQAGEHEYVVNPVEGLDCDCFFNCYSLRYMQEIESTHLPQDFFTGNYTYIEMDFYFRQKNILVYRTKLIYTWVDLLVSFGGIAGLFLGCSLVSVIELAYFFIMDTPLWVCRHRRQQRVLEQETRRMNEKLQQFQKSRKSHGELTIKMYNN